MKSHPFSTLAVVAMLISATHSAAAELDGIKAPGAEVRKVIADCKFTEGPAWSPRGFLVFSDIPNDRIVRVASDATGADLLNPSGRANGLVFDARGNLYMCQGGARRVAMMTAVDGKIEVLSARHGGKKLNSPNDLALDGAGGLYFTDPRYGEGEPVEQPVMGVYYVDARGKTTRVIEDLERPNGILVSNDGRWLYVAEPNRRELYRYEITGPGKIAGKKLIYTGDEQMDGGGPDGMALDEHGNIYATYAGIVVLSPEGKLIGRIGVPERPANCTFGGEDGKTLFITARTSLYAVPLLVAGAALKSSGPSAAADIPEVAVSRRVLPSAHLLALADEADAKSGDGATETVKIEDLTLVVPKSWKKQAASNRLRLAQFEIPPVEGDEEPAELVVSFFGGDGGGIDANVQRWIGQFEADGRKASVVTGTTDRGEYVIADISGTYNQPVGPPILRQTKPVPNSRMLSAILPIEGKGNYFLKLTGPDKTVAAASEHFRVSFGGDPKKEKEYKAPKAE